MLDELKNSLKKIIDNKDFAKWKKKHQSSYFTSAFLSDDVWQFDFLDPDSGMMACFKIVDNGIFCEESEIFRKERKEIKELDLNEIRIDLEKAEKLVFKTMSKEYKDEEIQKKFIVIQVLDKLVWNITYITKKFNVLNVKIDAVKGIVLEHSAESLFDFRSKTLM